MSKEDATDADLICAVRKGSKGALDILMRRHKRLVSFRARSYFLMGGDREDLAQEGMIGLFKAVRDFDLNANVPFHVFADLCITRQMMTAVKSASRQKHGPLNSYLSLSTVAVEDEAGRPRHRTVADFHVGDPLESVLAAERIRTVRELSRNHLTDFESAVLEQYLAGRSYREIAGGLDCGVKTIDNALQRIKRKGASMADN